MGVPNGLKDPDEKVEPFTRGKIMLVGDLDAMHQFHDEIGPAGGKVGRVSPLRAEAHPSNSGAQRTDAPCLPSQRR